VVGITKPAAMAAENLNQSILEFLNATRSAKCRGCGMVMKDQNVAFFCDGQSWEFTFPVCLNCHPVEPGPSYDA
jgi:hypothetical protein